MKRGNANRITVKDAAKLLGVSPQFVRISMQKGTMHIGTATQINKNKKRYTYHISPKLFREYSGIDITEAEESAPCLPPFGS